MDDITVEVCGYYFTSTKVKVWTDDFAKYTLPVNTTVHDLMKKITE